MARPLPRRRGRDTEEAPEADEYTSTSSRGRGRSRAADEEPEEERRPRRGRSRAEEPEEEAPRRGRGRSAKPEPEGDDYPATKKELADLDDDSWDELCEALDLDPQDATEEELWDAITEARKGDDAEDEEPPARGRGRGRRSAPAEDEEDEKPRRGRGRSSARDEEDEEPARGRGRGRSRSRDEDDEDDDNEVGSGFDAFRKTRKMLSNFDDFKLTDEQVLVKFMDDEPFAVYGEHGLYKELKDGQRVWICLKPKECPVCNTGHKARAVGLYNIVVIPEGGDPEVKVLKAGPKLSGILEKKGAANTGPLTKHYYSMSQSDPKDDGPVEYDVELVRDRDLEEEWDETPFTKAELREFEEKCQDKSSVKKPTLSQMKDIAAKLRGRD